MKNKIKTVIGISSQRKLSFKLSNKGITIRSNDNDALSIDDLLALLLNDFDLIKSMTNYLNQDKKLYHLQAVSFISPEIKTNRRSIYVYKIDEDEFPDELVATFNITEVLNEELELNAFDAFISELNSSIENLDIGILLELCRFYININPHIVETLRMSKRDIRKRRKTIFKYIKPDYKNPSTKVSVSDLELQNKEKLIFNRYILNNKITDYTIPNVVIYKKTEEIGNENLLININNQNYIVVFTDFIQSITDIAYNNMINTKYSKVFDSKCNKDFIDNCVNADTLDFKFNKDAKLSMSILSHSDSFDLHLSLCRFDLKIPMMAEIDQYNNTYVNINKFI